MGVRPPIGRGVSPTQKTPKGWPKPPLYGGSFDGPSPHRRGGCITAPHCLPTTQGEAGRLLPQSLSCLHLNAGDDYDVHHVDVATILHRGHVVNVITLVDEPAEFDGHLVREVTE